MKTFTTHTHDIHQSNTTKISYQNSEFYQNYDHAESNINKNATVAELEYQRDACEEELYRLRYGIEQLLANNDQNDFREQQNLRHRQMPNSMRTMSNRVNDFSDQQDDECSPCCRRYKGPRQDPAINSVHDSVPRYVSQDRNYDLISQKASEQSPRSPIYSDSFISTSSSPSIVSHNILPTPSHTRSNLRSNMDSFSNQGTSNNINFSELFASVDMNDPVLKTLILRILEAKAMDCLCTGYSKQNTQRQISDALLELNQRVDQSRWGSPSTSSSRSILSSYEPSITSPSSSSSSIKLDERKKSMRSPEKDTLSVPKNRMKSSKSKTKSSKKGKKHSTSSGSHKKTSTSSKSHKKSLTPSKSHKKASTPSRSHKKPSKSHKKASTPSKSHKKSSKSNKKSHKSRSKQRKTSSK